MMAVKKLFLVTVLILAVMVPFAASAEAATTLSLDEAVYGFTVYMAELELPGRELTAIIMSGIPAPRLGEYISDSLIYLLSEYTGLDVLNRQDTERLLEWRGSLPDPSDPRSITEAGRELGWKQIVFGEIKALPDIYRLSLRAVETETGKLLGEKNYNLTVNDPVLVNLVNPEVEVQQLVDRKTILELFDGKLNNFGLNMKTNKTVYYDGEDMFITLSAKEDCFFVIYHLDVNDKMQLIYPNYLDMGKNFLRSGTTRTIPESSYFRLHAPFGEERILLYAAEKPIPIPEDQYKSKSISLDYLETLKVIWSGGTSASGAKPKNAAVQVIYTILPK